MQQYPPSVGTPEASEGQQMSVEARTLTAFPMREQKYNRKRFSPSALLRRVPFYLAAWILPALVIDHGLAHELPEPGVSYTETPCLAPEEVDVELHCGHLTVPENYDKPDGLRLRLPVLRLDQVDIDHMAVVLGGGGPGASAARHEPDNVWQWEEFRQEVLDWRGLIIMDQRGVGEDYPLRCPGTAGLVEWEYSRGPSPAELEDAYTGLARECRRRLTGRGIDLANYTTRESARDYENLRRALGIRQLDLVGISYGGSIAFEMIESYPESVRVALLDSPLIPEVAPLPSLVHADRLFDRLASECLSDTYCDSNYGDMRINMKTALRRLEETPVKLSYPYWDTIGADSKFLLTRDRLSEMVNLAFYDEQLIGFLPHLLRDIAHTGESALVQRYVTSLLEYYKDEEFSTGLFISINCREQDPYVQDVEPNRTGINWYRTPDWWVDADYCTEVWSAGPPIPPIPPEGFDHPVLILSAQLDPITPAGTASALAARISSVQQVTIVGVHGLINTPCGQNIAWEFMRNPRAQVVVPGLCEWESWWY